MNLFRISISGQSSKKVKKIYLAESLNHTSYFSYVCVCVCVCVRACSMGGGGGCMCYVYMCRCCVHAWCVHVECMHACFVCACELAYMHVCLLACPHIYLSSPPVHLSGRLLRLFLVLGLFARQGAYQLQQPILVQLCGLTLLRLPTVHTAFTTQHSSLHRLQPFPHIAAFHCG